MDYDKKMKRNPPSCLQRGPGPKYQLRTLIGFDDHDPSQKRSPAYSMKFRPKSKLVCTGPGPYPIADHLTHRGFELPPAYTIGIQSSTKHGDRIPGPGAHAPENYPYVNRKKAAAYTMIFRQSTKYHKVGPGPIYMLPTCIGPEIPDVRAEPGYSMAFKRKLRRDNIGPGPAAYHVPLCTYKKQCPAYSMKFRHKSYDFSRQIPGPKYSYDIHLYKKRMPTYSFGVRYSECTAVAITPEDEI